MKLNFEMLRRSTIIMFLLFFSDVESIAVNTADSSHSSAIVWVNDHGGGRNQHAFFRQSIYLETKFEKAEMNVFADSRYILYVNGTPISYGPLRSFPESPVYDVYDLSSYLIEGENVVALKVRSNGTNTYQMPLSKAGFMVWGEIRCINKSYDLKTPGNWKASLSEGYVEDVPKMSFATGPMDIYDARNDPHNWHMPGFDDSSWQAPVAIKDPQHWGVMQPRNIPFLTHDKHFPHHMLWQKSILQDEKIYSFRVKSKDRTRADFNTQKRVFAYTWIYSPKPQSIETGTWWGEFFLNSEGPLQRNDLPLDNINRQSMTLDLKEGWNFFFIKYDIVWASWEFYFAVPRNADLVFSPYKKRNDDVFFKTAGPFLSEEEEKVLALELPFDSPKDFPGNLSESWVDKTHDDHAQNPAWNVAWSRLGEQNTDTPWKINDLVIKAGQPTTFAFDMGGKKLGRIFIEYDAPEGTRFDVGFSEDLINNRPWVLKRAGIYTGVGHVASAESNHYESFKPYGLRYMQVNITGHSEDVKIKRIGVISQLYPFELNGSFQSSDPMFDNLWKLGWRTLRVCAEDTYTDTPFRERGLYAGDALPQYAITLATSGDSRLIKRSLEVFQDHYRDVFQPGQPKQEGIHGTLNDFPLKTLEYFRWYLQMENDMEFARQLYPAYQNLITSYRNLETYKGLTVFPRVFIEWTKIQKSNTANTAVNALLARSYENMAWIAGKLGRADESSEYAKWADELTQNILTHCWDHSKGAFHDGYHEGERYDSWFPISSAYPVLFGLTRKEHDDKIRVFFKKELADIGNIDRQRKTTPYGGYYVLGALYKLEVAATAERFIRQYWSPMIMRHHDTAWENFGDASDGKGQGTLSHAWSGSPTFYMTSEILGVPLHFSEFDPDDLVVAPLSESLEKAEGTVPLPQGNLHISWHIVGDILFVDVDAPEQITWRVKPRGRLAEKKLIVNGEHIHEGL